MKKIIAIIIIGSSCLFSWINTPKTQNWAKKNLDVITFRNGDTIPEAKTDEEWEEAGEAEQAAWCYYNNDPANGSKYGKLYNWHAVEDSRGLAPKGYHIPSDEEWTTLIQSLGGDSIAGKKMKSKNGWEENGNGTSSSGFVGLPGGMRYGHGVFYDIGKGGYWWSSTDAGVRHSWYRLLNYGIDSTGRNYGHVKQGCSVRCLRD